MKLRIASPITTDSIVDGPGLRAVVWTQGCQHNCRGCHNPKTHSLVGGFEVDTKEIIEEIKSLKLHKGITLSGGEPFLQPEALEEIARESKNIGLDVWAYTGFTFEELLKNNNPSYLKNLSLLNNIDVLVDGKFIENKRDINLKFRGSSNQRIIDVKRSLESEEIIFNQEYMK